MKRKYIISATLAVALFLGLGVLFVAVTGKRAKHSSKMITMSSALIKCSPTPTPSPAKANTVNANAATVIKVSNANTNTSTDAFDPITGVWDASGPGIPKSKKTFRPITREIPAKPLTQAKKPKAAHKKVAKVSKPRKAITQPPKQSPNPPPTPPPNALTINVASKKVYVKGEGVALKATISGGFPPYKLSADNGLQQDASNPIMWFSKKQPDVGPHLYRIQVIDGKNNKATFPVSVQVVEPTSSPPPIAKTEPKTPPSEPKPPEEFSNWRKFKIAISTLAGDPSDALAWQALKDNPIAWTILLSPIIALIIFLVFGNKKLLPRIGFLRTAAIKRHLY